MWLVNKQGILEEIDPDAVEEKQKKSSKPRSSWGRTRQAPSSNEEGDGAAPAITRTSDRKKPAKKSFGSSFSKKQSAPEPGVITRTSDKKKSDRKPWDAKKEKPKQSSKSYAVWLLSKRDYSAANLRKKLTMRGYSAEEAEEAMTFVTSHKFQSDERYAEMKAHNLERGSGNMRVLMTLKEKGIDENLAREQIESLESEEERAIGVAAKFKAQIEKEGMSIKLKTKIYRFLASRGFAPKSVKAAMLSLQANSDLSDLDDY